MVWFSIIVITTIFISTETASVEIISTPTKVVVIKPKPHEPDVKLGRANWDSIDEKVEMENSTKLMNENKDLNTTIHRNNSSEHPEVRDWPSVFILKSDPKHPIICYSGKSLNIPKNNHDDPELSSIKEAAMDTNVRTTKKFVLSSDPKYPVMCQEVTIPSKSINNSTGDEANSTSSNVTCIRRDYEKNISAIFINEVGPIETAWKIFNSTNINDDFNIQNVENMGKIQMLNDTVVDCEAYGVMIEDKHLSSGAIASLLGVG